MPLKVQATKISLMSEAFLKTRSTTESMMDHIAEMETIFIKLEKVGNPVHEIMLMSILLSSVKRDKNYISVIEAI